MGEKYGRKAISLDSENVGGYYWMVQNLGRHGSLDKLYFLNKKRQAKSVVNCWNKKLPRLNCLIKNFKS